MLHNYIRSVGILTIPLIGLLDQLSKYFALTNLYPPQVFVITDFFDLQLAFNKGISFGFFSADNFVGTLILIGIGAALIVWLLFCLWQSLYLSETLGYGLIIGGAIGNIIDRFLYGAVIDFLHFHLYNYHFPIFNFADSAITLGVILILLSQAWHFEKNKQVT